MQRIHMKGKEPLIEEEQKNVPLQIKIPPADVIQIVANARCQLSIAKGGKEVSKEKAMIELIRRGNMGACGI